jgi:hypothetical protein
MVVDGEGGIRERRPIWLVLRADAPAFGVEDLARPGTRVRILADAAGIAELLRRERPRLAIVEGPGQTQEGGSGALAARLEALAAGSEDSMDGSIPGALPVGEGFELDLAARELRRAGRSIHLRPKEFLLLTTLAINPGRALTRAQLIDLTWSSNPGVDPRTVDVHIHSLRMKIEKEPQRPTHLVTIRGFGYRLDPARR